MATGVAVRINRAILGCTCCFLVFLYFLALHLSRLSSPSVHHANLVSTGLDEESANTGGHLVVSSGGYVRNCVTGDVIGHRPKLMRTEPLQVTTNDSPEDAKSRVDSFQSVFDKRAWGANADPAYKGLQASGNTTRFVTLPRSTTPARPTVVISALRLSVGDVMSRANFQLSCWDGDADKRCVPRIVD